MTSLAFGLGYVRVGLG